MENLITLESMLTDEQIFDYVHDHLSPHRKLFIDLHLLGCIEDQDRIADYQKWYLQCEAIKGQIIHPSEGFNVVFYDFKAAEDEERLAADDTLSSEAIQPFDGVREQHFKEVQIAGIPLRVTLTRYDDESIWLKMEALTATPEHRWFRIGIGSYRSRVYLDGTETPFYETELPASLFSSFANVLIQLQPSDHE
jgi:hypothetical protein